MLFVFSLKDSESMCSLTPIWAILKAYFGWKSIQLTKSTFWKHESTDKSIFDTSSVFWSLTNNWTSLKSPEGFSHIISQNHYIRPLVVKNFFVEPLPLIFDFEDLEYHAVVCCMFQCFFLSMQDYRHQSRPTEANCELEIESMKVWIEISPKSSSTGKWSDTRFWRKTVWDNPSPRSKEATQTEWLSENRCWCFTTSSTCPLTE